MYNIGIKSNKVIDVFVLMTTGNEAHGFKSHEMIRSMCDLTWDFAWFSR